jgi:hypothetical protein
LTFRTNHEHIGSVVKEILLTQIDRRFRLANNADSLGLDCTIDGAWLAGAPLLRMTTSGLAPRAADEVGALIKGAYGAQVDPSYVLPGLDVIARALNHGDLGRAMIAAVQLKLPELSWEGALRVAQADNTLAKYDPDEPRDARGEWTADGEASPNVPPSGAPASIGSLLPGGKLTLISDRGEANDNTPRPPPHVISYGYTMMCIGNARDPNYQSKVERCLDARIKCDGLIEQNKEFPRREDFCQWPDGSEVFIKFGMAFPIGLGKPF